MSQTVVAVFCGPRRSGRTTLMHKLGYRDVEPARVPREVREQTPEVLDKSRPCAIETCGNDMYEKDVDAVEQADEIRIYKTYLRDIPKEEAETYTEERVRGFLNQLTEDEQAKVKFVDAA